MPPPPPHRLVASGCPRDEFITAATLARVLRLRQSFRRTAHGIRRVLMSVCLGSGYKGRARLTTRVCKLPLEKPTTHTKKALSNVCAPGRRNAEQSPRGVLSGERGAAVPPPASRRKCRAWLQHLPGELRASIILSVFSPSANTRPADLNLRIRES